MGKDAFPSFRTLICFTGGMSGQVMGNPAVFPLNLINMEASLAGNTEHDVCAMLLQNITHMGHNG